MVFRILTSKSDLFIFSIFFLFISRKKLQKNEQNTKQKSKVCMVMEALDRRYFIYYYCFIIVLFLSIIIYILFFFYIRGMQVRDRYRDRESKRAKPAWSWRLWIEGILSIINALLCLIFIFIYNFIYSFYNISL